MPGAFAGNKFRVRPLNLCGVFEHNAGEVARGKCAIDAARETLAAEIRQVSAMIDMGVTEHDRVDSTRIKREMTILLDRFGAFPLEEPALQQNLPPVDLD